MQRASIEVVTKETSDFSTVVLNATYLAEDVVPNIQNGGRKFIFINT